MKHTAAAARAERDRRHDCGRGSYARVRAGGRRVRARCGGWGVQGRWMVGVVVGPTKTVLLLLALPTAGEKDIAAAVGRRKWRPSPRPLRLQLPPARTAVRQWTRPQNKRCIWSPVKRNVASMWSTWMPRGGCDGARGSR